MDARGTIRQEVALVQQYTTSYRRKMAELIAGLNAAFQTPHVNAVQMQSIRSCVEAVDMMLESHAQFAKAMEKISLS